MMHGSLPTWLADWLGVATPSVGDAASWRLEVAWPWPPWFTTLLVLGTIVWVATIYRREASSAGPAVRAFLAMLRLVALAVVLMMLSQAVITLQQTGPPAIALVIDRSGSMSTVDRYDDSEQDSQPRERTPEAGLREVSRLDLAKLLVSQNDSRLLRRLLTDYRLSSFAVAHGAERLAGDDVETLAAAITALSSSGDGTDATRLGDAIRQVLDASQGEPPAAIVLLSDGIVTDGSPLSVAAQQARERGVPLIAVGIGSDRQPRDVEIADVLVDHAVFRDDLVSFNVQVRSTGLAGEQAIVTLSEIGNPTPLAEQSVTLGADSEPQTVFLTHRPTAPGEHTYAVHVAEFEDETNRDNNRQQRTIAVRDEKIRVLLAFGYPNYEFRFLKSLFERDPTVELSTFLQDADPDYAEQDRTALRSFPIARDELLGYDVILLGDVDPQRLPRSIWPDVLALVAEKGGGVGFIAGPRWLPWSYADVPEAASLMPIDLNAMSVAAANSLSADVSRGFVVHPTPLGLRLPPLQLGDAPAESEQIWRSLPPLYWLAPIEKLSPAAQVLAEHPTHTGTVGRRIPAIVLQYAGAGKVLFHAIDSTWRWRLGAGDVYFARYWVQTIRYLARGKLASGRGAALTTDRREYERGEDVEVRLRLLDMRLAPSGGGASVVVESPGRARRPLALSRDATNAGVYHGLLSGLAEGDYDVVLAEPQMPGAVPRARFAVLSPAGEMARTAMDRAALMAAAEATRGKFYTFADASQLADELPRGRRVSIANLPSIPLWNRWWLLATFLAAIISEWILRKRNGMI